MEINKRVDSILNSLNMTNPPIFIEKIIGYLGVALFQIDLPDDISGILDLRNKPTIVVNKLHNSNRKRFSMAHELGHYVLHSTNGIHIDKKTFFRNNRSSEALDKIEIEANKFAAEILMPSKFLIQALNEYEDFLDIDEDLIATLANRFSVSTTAMSFKIQNLGYSVL